MLHIAIVAIEEGTECGPRPTDVTTNAGAKTGIQTHGQALSSMGMTSSRARPRQVLSSGAVAGEGGGFPNVVESQYICQAWVQASGRAGVKPPDI